FLGFLIWKLLGLIRERDNWRLGFSGERAVGEQLNQLMTEGCRVFHDFPLAKNWNIDHIVVAPTGVFAVETKTRRKGPASDTQQAHEVIYDGTSLQYPLFKDTRDLRRASTQAARLADFLNPHLNNYVTVQPILTLPGWFVISRALGEVIVVNPKMIDTAILSPSGNSLAPETIKDIARLLDEKCRDVEF
ncbi:MAG TPA: nuclease-related domain-containing protein, partial [Verrucomicrobiae bacterium]|nr:nuclease-related domain-containing protein [Verrucomicrobiae bacterium]